MLKQGTLYQVRLNGKVHGVVVNDGTVTECPREWQWAVGKPFEEFEVWVRTRKGAILPTGWPPVLHDNSFKPRKSDQLAANNDERLFDAGSVTQKRRRRA